MKLIKGCTLDHVPYNAVGKYPPLSYAKMNAGLLETMEIPVSGGRTFVPSVATRGIRTCFPSKHTKINGKWVKKYCIFSVTLFPGYNHGFYYQTIADVSQFIYKRLHKFFGKEGGEAVTLHFTVHNILMQSGIAKPLFPSNVMEHKIEDTHRIKITLECPTPTMAQNGSRQLQDSISFEEPTYVQPKPRDVIISRPKIRKKWLCRTKDLDRNLAIDLLDQIDPAFKRAWTPATVVSLIPVLSVDGVDAVSIMSMILYDPAAEKVMFLHTQYLFFHTQYSILRVHNSMAEKFFLGNPFTQESFQYWHILEKTIMVDQRFVKL